MGRVVYIGGRWAVEVRQGQGAGHDYTVSFSDREQAEEFANTQDLREGGQMESSGDSRSYSNPRKLGS